MFPSSSPPRATGLRERNPRVTTGRVLYKPSKNTQLSSGAPSFFSPLVLRKGTNSLRGGAHRRHADSLSLADPVDKSTGQLIRILRDVFEAAAQEWAMYQQDTGTRPTVRVSPQEPHPNVGVLRPVGAD